MDFLEMLQGMSGVTATLLLLTAIALYMTVIFLLSHCLPFLRDCCFKCCCEKKQQKTKTVHFNLEDLHPDANNMAAVNAYLTEQNRLNEEAAKKIKPFHFLIVFTLYSYVD